MNTNVLILLSVGLLWTGASLIFRLWFRRYKKSSCFCGEISKAWLSTLMGLGVGIFTAWLVHWTITFDNQVLIHLLVLIGIIPGFCFLLVPDPYHSNSRSPVILEVFSNRFGLFHIRLDGQERLGLNWEGHTLGELDLRKKNLLVLAIIRGEEIIPFPKGPEMLKHNDDLLIFGSMNELRLEK